MALYEWQETLALQKWCILHSTIKNKLWQRAQSPIDFSSYVPKNVFVV